MNVGAHLANVYASLLRKYDTNYMVNYMVCPSYLSKIVGPSDNVGKIVYFYKQDRFDAKTTNYVSPMKLKIKSDEDLDLTGSPLKDDCAVEAIGDMSTDMNFSTKNPWKLEEEIYQGIPIDEARSIISTENFQRDSVAADAIGSVWFLCSGADTEKTILLQYEFAANFFVRGVISFMAVVPTYTVTTQNLLRQHLNLIGNEAGIETHIENTYNIKSNISIKCSWSTASLSPSLVDLTTCDVTLSQTYYFSNTSADTKDFLNQLRILMTLRDEVVAYKLAESADMTKEPQYLCGTGVDTGELCESINKMMTEISEIDTNSSTERDLEDIIQCAKLRRLPELTDKLWEILKRCASYKDLKMAFNVLFQCAARCNIVNTPTNKNRLAEIITGVSNRRLAIPCLSGSEPLELLLEIGLEKLYRDYEYIFVESKICSANDLKNKSAHDIKENSALVPKVRKSLRNAVTQENAGLRNTLLQNVIHNSGMTMKNDIIGFKNSDFDEQATSEKLSKLVQIHCVLEHLLMININLNISGIYYAVCDQLLRKAPRIVDAIYDSMVDEIEIQISAEHIRKHLENKDPHSRRIVMNSINKLRQVKSTFYFNIENIFPPNLSEYFCVEDKEFNKENMYYSFLYRKISTVKRSE